MMGQFHDITGQRFGRLVALKVLPRTGQNLRWLFKCDCGVEKEIAAYHVIAGRTKSCGCKKIDEAGDARRIHLQSPRKGKNSTRLYSIWLNMKTRCSNPSIKQFKDYGGRGITVCSEWIGDFIEFQEWAMSNGYRDNLTIDRIDNDSGYRPDNCRWATHQEQNMNRRAS